MVVDQVMGKKVDEAANQVDNELIKDVIQEGINESEEGSQLVVEMVDGGGPGYEPDSDRKAVKVANLVYIKVNKERM